MKLVLRLLPDRLDSMKRDSLNDCRSELIFHSFKNKKFMSDTISPAVKADFPAEKDLRYNELLFESIPARSFR